LRLSSIACGVGGGGVPALEVLDVRLGVHGAPLREVRHLARRHLQRDLLRHRFRDPALQIEHVFDLAVVAVGPQRLVHSCGDELHRDAHALADEQRRALEDRVHAQLARDLGQRPGHALVLHRRRARDHAERLEARELRDQRLGHAVGEVLLRGVVRDVVERQHRQRTDGVGLARPGLRAALAGLLQPAQLAAQVERGLEPDARRLLEAAPDDAVEVGREVGPDVRERRRRVAQDGGAHVRRPGEGPAPAGQLVEHDPQREQVGPCVDRVATDLLGGHVGHRPHDLPGRRERCGHGRRLRGAQPGLGPLELREAEIQHLHPALSRHHHVRRLQVTVHHAALVCRRQRLRERDPQVQHARDRQPAGAHQLGEALALDQLHRQEANAVVLLHRVEHHDARMIEARDRPRLALEAGEAIGIARERLGQQLERNLTPEPRVLRPIQLAHAARAERRDDLVGSNAGAARHHHRGNLPQAATRATCAATPTGASAPGPTACGRARPR
jgi:hypothetical protein